MNMKLMPNCTFKRILVKILSIFVILAIAFPAMKIVAAQESTPFLVAFPEWESVEGYSYPLGVNVRLEIDDPSTADITPDYFADGTVVETGWGGNYVKFNFWGEDGYDLKTDDLVSLIYNGDRLTHRVRNLSVTNVDVETDSIMGIANPEEEVFTNTYDDWGVVVATTTLSSGEWIVNTGLNLEYSSGGRAQIYDDLGNSTAVDWSTPAPPPPAPWRDEFDGPLAEGWYWMNENPDKWNFNDGFLRIYNTHFGIGYGAENLLLRPVGSGDFSIETHVLFEPYSNFQFAGLIIYQDDNNDLALGRAFCDTPVVCVDNGIYFDYVADGAWVDGNFATPVNSPNEAYLRLERRGNLVKAFYSYEGITWFEIGTHWIPSDFQVNGVGLMAGGDYDTSDADIYADFDFFELTEGWGFLPEGFHDYDGGDVPSWACGVGGWAADPDDRAADLAIEVNVDGTSLPDWLYASEYRPDLEDAGVCVDGNCSFSASLWETIAPYETHSVVVYAQDVPSGKWVQLSNSPKTLTCRTFDIYAFDPQTGGTTQITDLRDTDEYNPSWSPNGKKVAYDVVSGDSQSIYVTDVKTGESTPLDGAQDGGNDPVWSPNGKWIVFDRAFDEVPSLYLVPVTGGMPTLVREDAVSADWAPSGKRLVFQQPSDGSIRTTPVDGGGGVETIIAASGANPAWSPDGNWVAYENNGDIWKVQVNVQGAVFGDPIQITSNPFSDGQPTWSADSLTIIYHSGFNSDWDLWSVPAVGGDPTWLTGAPEFGDYDPANAKNSPAIGYASFSPNGQGARQWIAAYTYDPGTWSVGDHNYYFESSYTLPEPGGGETTPIISFNISEDAPYYDGYVLLRSFALRARIDGSCPAIDPVIRPDQGTLLHYGWVSNTPMTYSEALVHFNNLSVKAYWDDGMSADLLRHEIFPFTSQVDWGAYLCTYTQ